MSPSRREREYARRRYEKWATKQQERVEQRRRVRRNAAVAGGTVVAVLAVVIGVFALRGSSANDAAPAALHSTPTASATAAASGQPSATGSAAAAANPCPAPTVTAPATPRTWPTPPAKTVAEGRSWTMKLATTCGTVTMTLDGAKAPQAVSSAIFLARNDFWNGSPCHRLVTGGIYVLQCGDPTGSGTGGPGYSFGPVENAPANGVYPVGTVAMARSTDPNSNGSQFFIVYKESQLPTDGGGYTIMGKVTSGLDVVQKVAAGGAQGGTDGAPVRKVSIVSATVAPA